MKDVKKVKGDTLNGPSPLVYIPLLLWTAFMGAMLFYIFGASLSVPRDVFTGKVFKYETGFHFENYVTAWTTQKLYAYFINSLIYAVVACAGALLIASPAAYVLSRCKFRGNELIKRILILVMSIPTILIVLPIYGTLVKLDMKGRIPLCIVYICVRVPYTTVFLLNFFESISKTYEEAAAIDGCTDLQTFVRIALPMVRPAMTTITLFNFLNVLNEYFIALLLITDQAATSLGVGLTSIVSALMYSSNYPAIFAAVVIVMMPSILIYCFTSRKIMYGGMGGGIKG